MGGERPANARRRTVTVDGVASLAVGWVGPGGPCVSRTTEWWTCPCTGFAFGERELDLLRDSSRWSDFI
jgi:hypothetical protein